MAGRGIDGQLDGVVEAAADLYGRPLAEFTAVRAERVKQARADGDRDAASAIGKLPKPNVVAWLANQLARDRPGELGPLLELGESLRRATADLDASQLRQLSRHRHQVVSALVNTARELAAAAGQAVSDGTARGLEDTLHAALADEQAAEQLVQGQLAVGLSRTGFPGLDAAAAAGDAAAPRARSSAASDKQARPARPSREAAAASPDRPSPVDRTAQRTRKAASDRRAKAARAAAEARRQQLERARWAEADARAEAEEASRDLDRTRAVLTDAEGVARQAEETISRLQDELDAALDARNNAGRAQRQARKDAERADRTARQAERRLTEATARREELQRNTY